MKDGKLKFSFFPKVLTEIKDKKGRIIVQTVYQNGWYCTVANYYRK